MIVRVMFRLQLMYNAVRRLFTDEPIGFDLSTIRFLEAGVEIMYGVDLNHPQHGHDEVKIKRFFINFLLEQTDWSISELHRYLVCAGFDVKGLSRRSLNYYVTTHAEALDGGYKSVQYLREYTSFTNSLKSIL